MRKSLVAQCLAPALVVLTAVGAFHQFGVAQSPAPSSEAYAQSYVERLDSNAYNPVTLRLDQVSPEQAAQNVLAKYGAATDDSSRAQLREELTAAVAAAFDTRQEAREAELKALEEKVKKLRGIQERRSREKSRIVESRVEQLIREFEGVGWGGDSDSQLQGMTSVPEGQLSPFGVLQKK